MTQDPRKPNQQQDYDKQKSGAGFDKTKQPGQGGQPKSQGQNQPGGQHNQHPTGQKPY